MAKGRTDPVRQRARFARLAYQRDRFALEARSPGAFTGVAGTAVLGTQLALQDYRPGTFHPRSMPPDITECLTSTALPENFAMLRRTWAGCASVR
jgi:hypothetical protein